MIFFAIHFKSSDSILNTKKELNTMNMLHCLKNILVWSPLQVSVQQLYIYTIVYHFTSSKLYQKNEFPDIWLEKLRLLSIGLIAIAQSAWLLDHSWNTSKIWSKLAP